MAYDEIRTYMTRLRENSGLGSGVEIDWQVIDPARITAAPHRVKAGLQVADAVASGFWYAFEPSPYGMTEDRYAKMLLPVIYKHNGHPDGYGIKVWPAEATARVRSDSAYAWTRRAQ